MAFFPAVGARAGRISRWTSCRLPRLLSPLYLLADYITVRLCAPDIDRNAAFLGVVVSIWQGILLLDANPEKHKRPR